MKQFWIFDFGFSIGRFKSRKVFCPALGALLLALCFPAEAQPQTRIPKSAGSDSALFRTQVAATRYFGRSSAPSAMLRGRTSSSSIDRPIISPIASLVWPMSWCVSKLTCLSRLRAMKP